MKFKKLIALSLTAIVGLSLTACGSDKKAEDNGNESKLTFLDDNGIIVINSWQY